MLINFNGAVPIPINHNIAVIGAAQVAINEKETKTWAEIGAVLAGHLRDKVLGKDSAKDPRVCALF